MRTESMKITSRNNQFWVTGDRQSQEMFRTELKPGKYEVKADDRSVVLARMKTEIADKRDMGSLFCTMGYVTNGELNHRIIGPKPPFMLHVRWLLDPKGRKVGIAVNTEI